MLDARILKQVLDRVKADHAAGRFDPFVKQWLEEDASSPPPPTLT